MVSRDKNIPNWRQYQKKLKNAQRRDAFFRRFPSFVFYSACSILLLILICLVGAWFLEHVIHADIWSPDAGEGPAEFTLGSVGRNILDEIDLDPARLENPAVFEKGEHRYIVKSSLDMALQGYITRLLKRSQTYRAAVVVLDGNDGRILAMVNYDKDGDAEGLCLKADFPAASLFKIVSAAAAMESAGFSPNKAVTYRGKRHTLYKSQLKNRIGRYSQKTSFKRAFASSINPVFGKMGIYNLGQEIMAEYAEKFLFNGVIPFDLPVNKSFAEVPEDDFGLAEIASGFNRKTKISPLHAALIASVVANNGVMVAPWLVERVKSEYGETLYWRGPAVIAMSVSPETAKYLKVLMHDTVVYGTCSKAFGKLRRKRAFKTVELGAKTGTINDEKDKFKYDWLTAYALSQNGGKSICIAVLGVHGKRLGIRANELGRYIIDYYVSS